MQKMIRTFLLIYFLLIPLQAQNYENDPLEDGYLIHNGSAKEFVNAENSRVRLYKYYREMELAPWDTLVPVLSYEHGYVDGISDMMVADLDGDSLSEIIKVWIKDDVVHITVLKADPDLLSIDSLAQWQKTVQLQKTSPPTFKESAWVLPEVVLVDAANLDSDPQREFVVAYWASNGSDTGYVNLTVFDVDDTLGVTEKGSIMDQAIPEPPKIDLCEDYAHLFELECGDFNGDGIDEVFLGGREPASPSGWQFFAKIYSYEAASGDLLAMVKDTIYTQPDTLRDVANLNLAIGQFTASGNEQAIVGFYQYDPFARDNGNSDTVSYTIVPFEVNQQLTEIKAGNAYIQKADTLEGNPCGYNRVSTLVAEDLNNDGLDEIVSSFSIEAGSELMKTFQIFQMDADLNLSLWADLDFLLDEPIDNSCLVLGDIRPEYEQEVPRLEMIISPYNASMYQIAYKEDGSFDQVIPLMEDIQNLAIWEKSEPAQVGDFDADIRLGKPNRYSVTHILQPLVILNAPPIHFDVLDNQIYDVCSSYNDNDPQFLASYIKESSQLTELETELNRDWALSTSVSAGFSFWGISVSSHFSQTWGEKFSKVDNTTTKVTVAIAVDAIEDDRIYAMVMDYDIWEYPIYVNSELKGNALVVEPHAIENRWFPSKSWSGHDYIPEHEVGNILSYREYPLLSNNPLLDEKIKGNYNNSFVLDANSSYDWELQFDDFQSSQVSTSKDYTRDWGASVSGWGAGFSINGSYHKEDINTQRAEVDTGLNLSVHLDKIDPSIGEVGYIVTPYAYWAKNGALVVDYAAKPELAPVGGTPTWWQVHYEDLADPAFILPWRYDPEKGYTLQEEAKRQQTKDLQFYPANPREGDDVTIKARIHNFSLIATPGLVDVRFYAGDPDSGGVLLENTAGQSVIYTNQAIPPRSTETVQFTWTVDDGTGAFPRIYAVIDGDHQLNEIHENNNKSWAILNKTTGTAIESGSAGTNISSYKLYQNYPNPFNPKTVISYQVAHAGQVELSIFNVLGQKITTLISEWQNAGTYSISWNASEFASGLYLLKMETGNGFVKIKKMVYLK